MGLSIAGGAETVLGCVVIHEVYPGSAAHSDGRLQAGDRILAVNGVDISGFSHNQASDVLRKAGGVVRLRIIRDEAKNSDTIKVRLNKVQGVSISANIRMPIIRLNWVPIIRKFNFSRKMGVPIIRYLNRSRK